MFHGVAWFRETEAVVRVILRAVERGLVVGTVGGYPVDEKRDRFFLIAVGLTFFPIQGGHHTKILE